MTCLIIFIAICLFVILIWFLLSFIVLGAGAAQKRKRTKKRAIADKVISSQKQLKASEINKLIDELASLNNKLIGESEEDRVRISKLRAIRNDT